MLESKVHFLDAIPCDKTKNKTAIAICQLLEAPQTWLIRIETNLSNIDASSQFTHTNSESEKEIHLRCLPSAKCLEATSEYTLVSTEIRKGVSGSTFSHKASTSAWPSSGAFRCKPPVDMCAGAVRSLRCPPFPSYSQLFGTAHQRFARATTARLARLACYVKRRGSAALNWVKGE
eukprot:6210390-Pleurochrysis_carterae.AAC.1